MKTGSHTAVIIDMKQTDMFCDDHSDVVSLYLIVVTFSDGDIESY